MLKAQAAALRAQQAKLARQKEATSTDGPGGSSAARTPGTRPSASATPVVVRKTGIGGGDVPEPSAATYGTLSAEVDDEYTPGQPNSYEDVVRLRTRRVATEAAARERERQRVELERQRHELEEERRTQEDMKEAEAPQDITNYKIQEGEKKIVGGEIDFTGQKGVVPG